MRPVSLDVLRFSAAKAQPKTSAVVQLAGCAGVEV